MNFECRTLNRVTKFPNETLETLAQKYWNSTGSDTADSFYIDGIHFGFYKMNSLVIKDERFFRNATTVSVEDGCIKGGLWGFSSFDSDDKYYFDIVVLRNSSNNSKGFTESTTRKATQIDKEVIENIREKLQIEYNQARSFSEMTKEKMLPVFKKHSSELYHHPWMEKNFSLPKATHNDYFLLDNQTRGFTCKYKREWAKDLWEFVKDKSTDELYYLLYELYGNLGAWYTGRFTYKHKNMSPDSKM